MLVAAVLLHTSTSVTNVTLFALVPWPDERPHADWDAGPDLLASARVAIKEINSDPNLLPGHRLLLEERGHEACGIPGGNFGIFNLVKYAVNPGSSSNGILAAIGTFCSSSTKAISPVAGRKDINLIQLSASNSPDFLKHKDSYPHLWRFLESATVHADAMVSIMDQFNWKKAALVVDFENSFFSGIGEKFIQTLQNRSDLKLLYQRSLLQLSNIEDIVKGIRDNQARIIFLATTAPQAARIYCIAARYNMHWPNYVWVLADYLSDVILDEVMENNYCSVDDLRKVMNGSLITYFSLEPDDPSSTVLVSNNTYNEYKLKYEKELVKVRQDYANLTRDIEGEYLYGGLIYDQVWAFALALNASLPEMAERNLTVSSYSIDRSNLTAILEKNLMTLDFVGATGRISFTENREVSNLIKIFQVSNFTDVTVGTYDDARNGNKIVINITDPPSDDITSRYTLLSLSLTIILGIFCFTSFLLVTTNMILIIALRKRNHEILAMSPKLSILIFAGCYMECLAAILITYRSSTKDVSELVFSILCNVETWLGMMGIYLILATSIFKIARIFRIFTYFGKTGRKWSDTSLTLYVLIVCSIPCLLFIAWMNFDYLKYTREDEYHLEIVPVYIEIRTRCYCEFYAFWFGFLYSYVGILICGLIFFAVQTRKINRASFKDTKKVIGFIFLMTVVFCVLIATEQILILTKHYIWGNVAMSLIFLSFCFICQLFLFTPKTFPVLYQYSKTGSLNSMPGSRRSSEMQNKEPHTFTGSLRRASRSSLVKHISQIRLVF